ncbi:hypothetical protein KM043_009197 [Ampulex compressa]|nr:hypothetical protein KM043_009197 [Ampulex compressa]
MRLDNEEFVCLAERVEVHLEDGISRFRAGSGRKEEGEGAAAGERKREESECLLGIIVRSEHLLVASSSDDPRLAKRRVEAEFFRRSEAQGGMGKVYAAPSEIRLTAGRIENGIHASRIEESRAGRA